jgi:hypothetical protein
MQTGLHLNAARPISVNTLSRCLTVVKVPVLSMKIYYEEAKQDTTDRIGRAV